MILSCYLYDSQLRTRFWIIDRIPLPLKIENLVNALMVKTSTSVLAEFEIFNWRSVCFNIIKLYASWSIQF